MDLANAATRWSVKRIARVSSLRVPLRSLLAVVMLLALGAAPSNAAPNERTGWMAGVGFLLGSADLETRTGFDTGWVSGVTPQIRFGWMAVDERLMLSLENKQWTREKGNPPDTQLPPDVDFIKYQISSQVFNLVLTTFPGRPESLWGGFYLNVGAGPAVARLDSAVVDTLYSGEDPPEVVSYDWGWGWFAGGGYEYRFMKSVAAGLSLNYVYASIKGEYIERTKIWTLAATLNWYF